MRVLKEDKKVNRTVLAITDFSRSSTNAILFVANLFKYGHLKLILLNTFETPSDKAALLISVNDILSKDSETGLQKQSTDITSILKGTNLNILIRSHPGRLNKAISKIIHSEDIDLIVSGISPDKYPFKNLNNIPLLFMGQSKFPILIVPESHSPKPIKNVLILILTPESPKNILEKGFEHIVNHDHLSKHIIQINEKKMDKDMAVSIRDMLTQKEADLLMLIPAPGDRIDRAMLDYQVQELCPLVASLLNP